MSAPILAGVRKLGITIRDVVLLAALGIAVAAATRVARPLRRVTRKRRKWLDHATYRASPNAVSCAGEIKKVAARVEERCF
jgi:NADH:ubiquinone oxidoreductase subunit H